jgi:hypothetical protein
MWTCLLDKCTQKELWANKDRRKILFTALFGQKVDFSFQQDFFYS